MYKINAVDLNLHYQNTYDVVFHNQRERYTRFKHNLPYHVEAYITDNDKLNTNDYSLNNEFVEEYWKKTDDILAFTYTNGGIRMCKDKLPKGIFEYEPKKLWDFWFEDNMYYIDHHQSHATYAFINSGFKESDILAIDGIGARYRCIFVDKSGNIKDLSKELPIGWVWNQMTKITGFW